jgi:[NiFe] hydrogenase assembly HybE family chaperone
MTTASTADARCRVDPALEAEPAQRLAARFRAAAARMAGLAIVNPALEVEAVGFARWNGRWLGVMVTPWAMNLVLLPDDPQAWRALASGAKRRYAFPAGEFEFVGASDPDLGDYQVCSLFSPMDAFADQAAASLVAKLARAALFDPANAAEAEVPAPAAAAGEAPGPLARIERALDAPLSKRGFLRGRFIGGDDDHRG